MEQHCNIEIKNGKKASTYHYQEQMKAFGLNPKKTGQYTWIWTGTAEENKAKEIQQFCREKKLKCVISLPSQNRNSNYRTAFFNSYKLHYKDVYICSYCLLPYHKKNITVDHLIPVQKAKTNKSYQWMMQALNINNINDPQNLVPACKSCNSKKGSKGGLWIIRGYLGTKLPAIITVYAFVCWLIIYVLRYAYVYFS